MFSLVGFLKGLSLQDVSDRTKQFVLQISPSATTGTTTTLVAAQTADRTITLPDGSGTFVTADSIVTLTNKTFGDALLLDQIATPADPPSNENKLYFKSDNHLYSLNSSGGEVQVDAAAASNPMTTKGDMIVGAPGGTPARLAGGTTGQLLTYDTTATDNVKWATLSVANNFTISGPINDSNSTTSFTTPLNGSVVLVTTGRSVLISLVPNTGGTLTADVAVDANGSASFISGIFEILRDGTSIGIINLAGSFATASSSNGIIYGPSSIQVIDTAPTSASHTYSLQYRCITASTVVGISNCMLLAKEF